MPITARLVTCASILREVLRCKPVPAQRLPKVLGMSCGLIILTGFCPQALNAQYLIAQKIADPAYFVPGPLWDQLDQSTPSVGIAVANVINGPDYQANADYATAIQAASAAGIKVLGYVRTGYLGSTGLATRLGQTDTESWLAQIEQDVNAWYSFYGRDRLAGIFFDETQNTCGSANMYANLYSSLTAYVKQNYTGALVADNPGTAVPSCFQRTAHILLTFEGTYLCYIRDASCPAAQQYTDLSWNPVDPRRYLAPDLQHEFQPVCGCGRADENTRCRVVLHYPGHA